jgi:hypothetical protein
MLAPPGVRQAPARVVGAGVVVAVARVVALLAPSPSAPARSTSTFGTPWWRRPLRNVEVDLERPRIAAASHLHRCGRSGAPVNSDRGGEARSSTDPGRTVTSTGPRRRERCRGLASVGGWSVLTAWSNDAPDRGELHYTQLWSTRNRVIALSPRRPECVLRGTCCSGYGVVLEPHPGWRLRVQRRLPVAERVPGPEDHAARGFPQAQSGASGDEAPANRRTREDSYVGAPVDPRSAARPARRPGPGGD